MIIWRLASICRLEVSAEVEKMSESLRGRRNQRCEVEFFGWTSIRSNDGRLDEFGKGRRLDRKWRWELGADFGKRK
ncbi:hypothetical protein IEQ34_019855 [Dendrobium chrysotoxum]|uniref:Uncharacterized protein n=1 Tax=Dendrobium chrysotoxum TaxID=161865 RepID=A0AAV7G8M1_DENCH|nr:hypothetical protein IEQ34_019855 [Dendrobium chrysotoxum]